MKSGRVIRCQGPGFMRECDKEINHKVHTTKMGEQKKEEKEEGERLHKPAENEK